MPHDSQTGTVRLTRKNPRRSNVTVQWTPHGELAPMSRLGTNLVLRESTMDLIFSSPNCHFGAVYIDMESPHLSLLRHLQHQRWLLNSFF
jgi:hypothetical protein